MLRILQASLIYRVIAAVAAAFGGQWRASAIISRFLAGARVAEGAGVSILTKLRAFLGAAFRALRLDKLLRGSIFLRPDLWCAATLALSPIIPTLAAAGLAGVSMLSALLKTGADAAAGNQPPKRAEHHTARYAILFAGIYFVSIFTSVTVSGSLYGGLLQSFFALFSIVMYVALRDDWRGIMLAVRAFALSGAAVAGYGILQYLRGASGASGWLDAEMFSGIGLRVYSTLGNPNVLAEYLLLVIPFSAALILTEKRAIAKLVFTGALGAMLLCMALTFARGGWLGLIIAAAVFLVMLDRRFILIGIVGLAALYFLLPDVIISRFLSIGNLKDGSTSYRVYIWLGTLSMLRDFWLVGIGPGVTAFNKMYPLYGYNAVAAPHSHNQFLQLVCDAGVTALVIFVIILFSHLRSLAASIARSTDKTLNYLRIAAISAMLGFLAQGVTDYSFYNYRVTLMFWASVGLGMALSCRDAAIASPELNSDASGNGGAA
ncbi:MAG: O-antigen ligase family protein [Oscillospiraceae bacterium]|jgi:putative inorganic carbon (HCO3(-)) transporter|nr:O-antigen ligase family protein [Oscillospiraceae bacterium]